MRKTFSVAFLLFIVAINSLLSTPVLAIQETTQSILIEPGDSWATLAWRFRQEASTLLFMNHQNNPHLDPAIGTTINVPTDNPERFGKTITLQGESLLPTAIAYQISPHALAKANHIINPAFPFYGTIFVPNQSDTPRILPNGFSHLALSHIPAKPGVAIGWRGVATPNLAIESRLNGRIITTVQNGSAVLGLTGTGAFFGSGTPLLEIVGPDGAYWTQPWAFQDMNQWTFQQLTLTGDAAQIDQEAIQVERERLFKLWEKVTPTPQWSTPFDTPVNSFLNISSEFGARRSYNGGPYRTYHEGVDYAAYGGTAVTAPAAGTVIVSEFLYVRGGTVIIDHGLGVYTGYYHLSSLAVTQGTAVQPGDLLGEVGTTGLSTGNHLHWDLLVDAIWVDALSWQEDGMAEWILAGWNGQKE